MTKSGRPELGDNIYRHYRSIFNHCDVFGQQNNRIRWKKMQNKVYYAAQGHSRTSRLVSIESLYETFYQWLIVTDILSRRLAPFRSYRSSLFDTLRFLSHPLGELRGNVQCSSWAHWKAHSGLPTSVNRTCLARCYGWGAIQAKIDRKSATSLQRGEFEPKFQVERDVPHQSFFAWIVRPMNALQLCFWQFHTKKLCSRLSSTEVWF